MILIILAVLVLSYLKIDLRNLASSDLTQGNAGYLWSFVQNVWYDYVKTPTIFLLHSVLQIVQ